MSFVLIKNFHIDEYRTKFFPLLFKYQSIDDDPKASEEFIRGNTELLHEHATGWLLLRYASLLKHLGMLHEVVSRIVFDYRSYVLTVLSLMD